MYIGHKCYLKVIYAANPGWIGTREKRFRCPLWQRLLIKIDFTQVWHSTQTTKATSMPTKISNHKTRLLNRRFTSPNDNVHCSHPHSNACFGIFIFKAYYVAPKSGALGNIKSDVSQWETSFHYGVGFATVYNRLAGYTVANFWRFPILGHDRRSPKTILGVFEYAYKFSKTWFPFQESVDGPPWNNAQNNKFPLSSLLL